MLSAIHHDIHFDRYLAECRSLSTSEEQKSTKKRRLVLARIRRHPGWTDFPDNLPRYFCTVASKNTVKDFGNNVLTAIATLAALAPFDDALINLEEIYHGWQTRGRLTRPIIKACIERLTQEKQVQTPPDTPRSSEDLQERDKTMQTGVEQRRQDHTSNHSQARGPASSQKGIIPVILQKAQLTFPGLTGSSPISYSRLPRHFPHAIILVLRALMCPGSTRKKDLDPSMMTIIS